MQGGTTKIAIYTQVSVANIAICMQGGIENFFFVPIVDYFSSQFTPTCIKRQT